MIRFETGDLKIYSGIQIDTLEKEPQFVYTLEVVSLES